MTRKYFGTDGIRGKANVFPMTADMAMKVAMATAAVLKEENGDLHQNRAVIGKDTRLSGYMLEQAIAAGFEAMGINVTFLGPIPTPAVALLTRSLRADIGVMISASHNPYDDNGIKLFGADGYKLSDELEHKIEDYIERDLNDFACDPDAIGKATRLDDATGRYLEFIKSAFPKRENLSGLKVVVDCANGAAYKVAPQILWELEAEVVPMGVTPNGKNINTGCGATDTAALQERVVLEQADLGLALDGDADRLIMVDEKGDVVDGDQLMAILATFMHERGRLSGGGVVATVMSNLGLERYLKTIGLELVRTAVGDRYVVSEMREGDYNLGGEQSGHLILRDYATTGDGCLAALAALGALNERRKTNPSIKASEAFQVFEPLPQILKNVRYDGSITPLDDRDVVDALSQAEETLANDGRLVVRASGTEPVIRVMAEGDDPQKVETVVDELCAVIARVSS